MFRDSRGVVHTVSSADPLEDLPAGAVLALQTANDRQRALKVRLRPPTGARKAPAAAPTPSAADQEDEPAPGTSGPGGPDPVPTGDWSAAELGEVPADDDQ